MYPNSLPSHPYLSATRFHTWLETHILSNNIFVVEKEQSIEGRDLFHLRYGNGPIHVLMWSQMHGNEATATYCLSDFFLEIKNKNSFWKELEGKLTIHFVPMLNPDGSERFTRHNALGSDLNREALKPTSPELLFLLQIAQTHPVQWAFNLHDQRDIFSVGHSPNPATISVLAPQSITAEGKKSREIAKQMLSGILKQSQQFHKNQVARFNDEYYPRALGEYFQNQGIATVLIECGGHQKDPLRLKARTQCYEFLKLALSAVAEQNFSHNSTEDYENCPINAETLRNILIRNLNLRIHGEIYKTDVALMKKSQVIEGHYSEKWMVNEIGDQRHLFGYQEIISPYFEIELKNGPLLPETEFPLEHLPPEFLAYFENLLTNDGIF